MKNIKKRSILNIIILQIVLFNISIVISYASNVSFRNITNRDGISQSTVETMIQDKEGYIWIGTNDGLNRYNGYDFKIFKHNDKLENSIANNYIIDLKEDKSGNIWVGTANGLSKINTKNDKITNYFSQKENGNLSHNNIGEILITNDNKIIVGTSKGLNFYDEENDKFVRFLSEDSNLSSQFIRTLAQDKNGDIWVGTKIGLNKIDVNKKKIYRFYKTENKNSISENSIYKVYYDEDGYIWAGTTKNGLNKIDINTHEIIQYKHNKSDKNSIPGNYVRDIFKDSKGIIWIATDAGLCKFNQDKKIFTTYKNNNYDRQGLIDNEIFSIIEDNSGLLWIGTYSGISIFDNNNKIEHYKQNPFDENSLSGNIIHGIYEDEQGLLWVGTSAQGINIIDRKNNKIYHLNVENSNNFLTSNFIKDITGKEDKIYIATRNGLNIINKKEKTIVSYGKKDGIIEDNISSLFLDSQGYLWMGTFDGISIFNTKTNKILDITNKLKENGLDTVYARTIYEDKEGIYWIGCFVDEGLIKINPPDKSIKRYKSKENDNTTISSDTVRSIKEDENGQLWIGTSYGLNKFNKKTETFTRYTTSDGLANDIVYEILFDENNNLWASTNKGISKFNIKENTFENFSVTDGLQGNEFNGKASFKNKKGEFFFGGLNGLNTFYPSQVKKHSYTPNIIFDRFEVNGEWYSNIDKRTFKSNENSFYVKFFLPDYRNVENITYYYKLEGASDKWNEVESNDINYSNLSPGKYKLKVRARSHNGIITDESSVTFTISPPFYLSGIAIIIYILIIVLMIYWYINRMKYLDKLVHKKTEELNKEMEKNNELFNKVIQLERNKNNYFINLSHELRTPLNVIYTTEQLIREFNKSENGIEREKLTQYMDVMRRNTKRLLNLINNLIDTAKIEHGKYKIDLQENDIVYIVEETTLSLKDYVESKGIELIIDPEIEEKIIMCDAYEIERCIVNLVGNAAKFTPNGGKIEVSIKELNNKVMISIEDTGIGIDSKYLDKIFDRFNQIVDKNAEVKGGSGLGLTITKHIIELHQGEIYVESELNKGSKFIIIL